MAGLSYLKQALMRELREDVPAVQRKLAEYDSPKMAFPENFFALKKSRTWENPGCRFSAISDQEIVLPGYEK